MTVTGTCTICVCGTITVRMMVTLEEPPPLGKKGVLVLKGVPPPAMEVRKLLEPESPTSVGEGVREGVGVLVGGRVAVGVGVFVTVGVAVGQSAAWTFCAGSLSHATANKSSTIAP